MEQISMIVVVEDVVRSRHLYEDLLHQQVVIDFGIYNVGFAGGFAMYKKSLFQDLVGDLKIADKSNNFVLYLEADNLVALEQTIAQHGFEFIHRIREQPWQQRIFRFYDYDNHIVEVGEKMDLVSLRLHQQGKTIEEIAKITGIDAEKISQDIDKYNET